MMKLAMICHDLTVKQYHLACAIADNYSWDLRFYYTRLNKINWGTVFKQLPYLYNAGRCLKSQIERKAFYVNYEYGKPLDKIQPYNPRDVEEYAPDIIYITSASQFTCKISLNNHPKTPFILDIEDSQLFRTDYKKDENRNEIKSEGKLTSHEQVKIITWGSHAELTKAYEVYGDQGKPSILLYPLVARRTLPPKLDDKTPYFSAVYLGSIWQGKGYRNLFPIISEIAESRINLHVYLLNSWNKPNWKRIKKLGEKYPNLTPHPFTPYAKAKQEISRFHVGLCGSPEDYEKTNSTYGMKPLEYAYAGVQPVSLGIPIRNLSDGREFGYCSSPQQIQKEYQHNLDQFDREYHLMDNHLDQLIKEMEAII